MKTKISLITICIALNVAFAQTDRYYEEMSRQIQLLYSAKSADTYQAVINSLNRIANAETTKWEPHYYSAFAYVMMANQEKESSKKDALLDLALTSIEKGTMVTANESELVGLEGFVHMNRLNIDPASRAQQFSGLSFQCYDKALGLNPDNPRVLTFIAQMQFGTAQFMGTSTTKACEKAQMALEKFESYKSANPITPQWGKPMAEALASKCM